MDLDLIASELADTCIRKYAEEAVDTGVADIADEDEDTKLTSSDTKRKLMMAAVGAGALGVAGLGAWALSGDTAKNFGKWVGDKIDPEEQKSLAEHLLHPVTAGGLAGFGYAGKRLLSPGKYRRPDSNPSYPDVDPKLKILRPVTNINPLSSAQSPTKFVSTLEQLGTETADPTKKSTWEKLLSEGDNTNARSSYKAFTTYMGNDKLKGMPKDKGATPDPDAEAWKKALNAKPTVAQLSASVQGLAENPRQNVLNAAMTGLYTDHKGKLVPVDVLAKDMGVADFANKQFYVRRLVDGVIKTTSLNLAVNANGSAPALHNAAVDAGARLNKNNLSPVQVLDLWKAKQINAPIVYEMYNQLSNLSSRTPAQQGLLNYIKEEIFHRNNVGLMAEAANVNLPRNKTPPDAFIHDVAARNKQRAAAILSATNAVNEVQHGGSTIRRAGAVALGVGGAIGLGQMGVSTTLSALRDRGIGK